jgi:hypothetical protein
MVLVTHSYAENLLAGRPAVMRQGSYSPTNLLSTDGDPTDSNPNYFNPDSSGYASWHYTMTEVAYVNTIFLISKGDSASIKIQVSNSTVNAEPSTCVETT